MKKSNNSFGTIEPGSVIIPKIEPICANCAFFYLYESGNMGECRVDPPIPPSTDTPAGCSYKWPFVYRDDWCGKGQAYDGTSFILLRGIKLQEVESNGE